MVELHRGRYTKLVDAVFSTPEVAKAKARKKAKAAELVSKSRTYKKREATYQAVNKVHSFVNVKTSEWYSGNVHDAATRFGITEQSVRNLLKGGVKQTRNGWQIKYLN